MHHHIRVSFDALQFLLSGKPNAASQRPNDHTMLFCFVSLTKFEAIFNPSAAGRRTVNDIVFNLYTDRSTTPCSASRTVSSCEMRASNIRRSVCLRWRFLSAP